MLRVAGAVRDAFQQLGPEGPQLFETAIFAVRTSLATAIGEAFWVAMFVTLASVFVGVFLKEVPIRRTHDFEGEPSAAKAPASRPPALSDSLTAAQLPRPSVVT